jgi:hypothetical protein
VQAPRRNIELKATDPVPSASLEVCRALGAEDRGTIAQRDTYFEVSRGGLKLREEQPGRPHLIQFERASEPQQRESRYRIKERRQRCVDPAQIKSVDARTFDELTVHTRRGVSRSSSLNAFELDVSRNLLRGVTGTSGREELPGQLTGAATLTINSAATLEHLPQLAATLLKAYKARRYRDRFRLHRRPPRRARPGDDRAPRGPAARRAVRWRAD